MLFSCWAYSFKENPLGSPIADLHVEYHQSSNAVVFLIQTPSLAKGDPLVHLRKWEKEWDIPLTWVVDFTSFSGVTCHTDTGNSTRVLLRRITHSIVLARVSSTNIDNCESRGLVVSRLNYSDALVSISDEGD